MSTTSLVMIMIAIAIYLLIMIFIGASFLVNGMFDLLMLKRVY